MTPPNGGGRPSFATGDAEKTFQAYCRPYETTVSPDLTFGVHAMAVVEWLWDERRFIRYAGERRLHVDFVTASFYDHSPGEFTRGMDLPHTISHLRDAAVSAGLTNLFYAVDEGRILFGKTRDVKSDQLGLRVGSLLTGMKVKPAAQNILVFQRRRQTVKFADAPRITQLGGGFWTLRPQCDIIMTNYFRGEGVMCEKVYPLLSVGHGCSPVCR